MNEREIAAGLGPTPGYRYADVVGDQLFVAGQVPHDAQRDIVGIQRPDRQALKCLENLQTVIEVHSFELSDIRQIQVYVVGTPDDLGAAWSSVASWFDNEVPPATLLGVARLGHPDQLVEIDATVIRTPRT